MPVPKGYTLENTPGPPAGYTLESAAPSGQIPVPGTQDPSSVAGAGPLGVPGIPAAPNPISNPLSGNAKTPQDRAVAQQMEAGDSNSNLSVAQLPQVAQQFGQAAYDNAKGAVKGAVSGIKNLPHGSVMAPLMGGFQTALDTAGDIAAHRPGSAISRLAGGDPDKAEEDLKQGNVGGYAWNMFGQPVAISAATEGASRAMTGAANLVRPLEGPKTNDAFANWISGGVKSGAPQETAAVARPVFQQAAQNLGWKNQNFIDRIWKGNTPSRNTLFQVGDFRNTYKGMLEGQKLADEAVNISDKPMDVVMQQAGNDPIDSTVKANISNGLRAKATAADSVGNGATANNYRSLADKVDQQKTYGELNALKKNANNQVERMGAPGTISEQIAQGTTPIAAWQDLGGLVRENMYPALQNRYIPAPGQKGYFDLAQMGQREQSVLDARDGVYKGFDEAAHLDAKAGSQTIPEKATTGSMYRTKFWLRMLGAEPTPAGKYNILMRRGLGDLGVGATPETTLPVPVQRQLALPAPPGYAQFQVPTAPAVPGTVGAPTPMAQSYVGTLQYPNPNFNPLSTTSRFQQVHELGSTAGTIPDSVRGPQGPMMPPGSQGTTLRPGQQTPGKVRADQIGLGHGPNPTPIAGINPPLRSITGPETLTKANFEQHFGTAHAPDVTHGTAGMLQTNDPAVAQRAYTAMQNYMKSSAFQKLPPQTQILANQQAQALAQQLASHQAVQGMAGPVQYQIHWTPADLGTKAGRSTGVIKRGIAGGARYLGQGGLDAKGKSDSGKTPEQRQAEQDEIIRNYKEP